MLKSHWQSLLSENLYNSAPLDESGNISLRIISTSDRNKIIEVINVVAGEGKYLQTNQYVSTPVWESLLVEGINVKRGLLLLAVEDQGMIVGFARLYPDDEHGFGRRAGNIGIALLRSYRSRGIGAIILRALIACAVELDYDVLTANILESNIRSRRLFARQGFKEVNCQNIYLVFLNDHVNELYYEVESKRSREVELYDL